MVDRTRIIKFASNLLVCVIGVIFLFIFKEKVYAVTYSCLPGGTCVQPGSTVSGIFSTSCNPASYTWQCSGTDGSCTETGGHDYYMSLSDCIAQVNLKHTGCCSYTSSGEECNDCSYGDCPAPLANTGSDEYKLENYRSCDKTGSCAGTKYGDCYEPGTTDDGRYIPTASISVLPNTTANNLGFSSSTYTGNNINQPVHMVATFTDANGSSDIEAGYVWLKTDNVVPGTPQYIDTSWGLTGKTYTNNSFGFMMHREGGNWYPYITLLDSDPSNNKWVRSSYYFGAFNINNAYQIPIAQVQMNNISESGNTVTIDFVITFLNPIQNGSYNIFVMANDVFGFTPYDNYDPDIIKDYWDPNQIRDYNKWVDSGRDWKIDLESPYINNLQISVKDDSTLNLSWSAGDNQNLYAVVGNVYASDAITNPSAITFTGTGFTINPLFTFRHQLPTDTIGHLINGYAFKKVNINSTSSNDSIDINIGTNRGGTLIAYLTVFDYGGNTQSGGSTSYVTYDLKDWMITKGGFVYSSNGIGFDIKTLSSGVWDGTLLQTLSLDPQRADISTELFGDDKTVASNPLKYPTQTLSYYINRLSPNMVEGDTIYSDLRDAFQIKLNTIISKTAITATTLSGTLCTSGDCSRLFYKLPTVDNQDVTVSANFNCNGRGIFFVSGNLTIYPDLLNTHAQRDACIFVVKGNVNIKGSSKTGSSYDQINAYIIANGSIVMDADTGGLIVKGGLIGLGNDSVQMNRYMGLNYKNTFPALVVLDQPKYAIFSKDILGNQVDITKTEVGYKPY